VAWEAQVEAQVVVERREPTQGFGSLLLAVGGPSRLRLTFAFLYQPRRFVQVIRVLAHSRYQSDLIRDLRRMFAQGVVLFHFALVALTNRA
jgi:hypothetical protein